MRVLKASGRPELGGADAGAGTGAGAKAKVPNGAGACVSFLPALL